MFSGSDEMVLPCPDKPNLINLGLQDSFEENCCDFDTTFVTDSLREA